MSAMGPLLQDKRIVVCCGAGGVGKTTTSAALALGAARQGQRVLVLTIDPSRRLAQALGVTRNTTEPMEPSPAFLAAAGVRPPGSLHAWMLDPKLVSDQAVRRLARSPAEAEKLIGNPIYGQVTRMVAGMQEYTAMEALHGFVEQGIYDLVILDTPPARNALNFLEAPGRLAEFLDGRIFQLLLPQQEGRLFGTTRRVVERILAGVFGTEFYSQLQMFFNSFASIFARLNGNAQRMRERLQEDDVTFLLVASPAEDALEDARYFRDRIRELGLPLGGMVLNRCRFRLHGAASPGPHLLPADASPAHHSALAKLMVLAEQAATQSQHQAALLTALRNDLADQATVIGVPDLGRAPDDAAGLASLAAHLGVGPLRSTGS